MPYFGLFRLEFKKNIFLYLKSAPSSFCNCKISISTNICHIGNQHHRICIIAKFCRKTKTPKFGTKIAFFVHF